MKFIKQMLAFAVAAVSLGANAANLVQNSSFEDTVVANRQWSNFANLPGWTGGALGIEVRNNIAGVAQDGANFVELATTGNSSMSQTIFATGLVELSFWYAARPSTTSNDIDFSFGGLNGTVLHGVTGGASHNWQQYKSVVDLGNSGSAVLSFYSHNNGLVKSYGGSLDNISVTAVPEPETYAMLLAGLGVLGWARRRKNKSV
ncbi:FxDxF family PEP-CTERM protein [Rhodoferax sp.]|uniref:FxDxF family PEP-CTERM protein n=1 Tax=Rhodoferax sp. TaxID=50421 RepID=UPI00262F349E|nr:FxDxF family PEP-CTERM protein [Rhodoferax sp.]MDD2811466.1 FxDxF family PEP-CTERM protein [Rhodoferax sp.]MDD4943104.1 FxDxF family PEP-CTERM protein [Rhodoferax sp.]